MASSAHILESLGWALLHSLWQGALACIVVLLFRGFATHVSARARFAVQYCVLIAAFVAFLMTFGLYLSSAGAAPALVLFGAEPIAGTFNAGPGISSPGPGFQSYVQSQPIIGKIVPWVGTLWCAGFALMALRYGFGFAQARRLQRTGLSAAPAQWTTRFERLARKMNAPQRTRLWISSLIDHPVALGIMKPVVLVPASFLTALPADQIEAILLHELAHIRRSDYLLNLIQTAIKSVFFFHPAIHLICRFLEDDREIACDDFAVTQGSDATSLALGLAALRVLRPVPDMTPNMAMAAAQDGSQLVTRIRNLVGDTPRPAFQDKILSALIAAALLSALTVGTILPATATPDGEKIQVKVEPISDKIQPPMPAAAAKVKQTEFKHKVHGTYSFQGTTIKGRHLTVKVTEDGRSWIPTPQGWVDVDKNPDAVDLLPLGAPRPPEPAKFYPIEKIRSKYAHKAEKFLYKDEKVMDQFAIDMQYFEASIGHYCDHNAAPAAKAQIRDMEAKAKRHRRMSEAEFETRKKQITQIKTQTEWQKTKT